MLVGKDLRYEVGNREVFSGVDIAVSKKDKVGLIGPNGAGKSSLLRILAGEILPTEGAVTKSDIEVGLLPQDLSPYLDDTVYEFVEQATGVKAVKSAYELAERQYNQDPNDFDALVAYSEAAERLGHFDVDSFDGMLSSALRQAGLADDYGDKKLATLSGGQRTRVALTAIMADRHDVILLDEPTNNLDMEGIRRLEKFIQGSPAAFLMVSHDRRFLRNATTRIVELLGGDRGVNNYRLGYDEYVEARAQAYIAERARYEQHELAVKSLKSAARDARVRANSAESGGKSRSDNDKLNANYRAGRASSSLSRQARGIETRLEQLQEDAPHRPQEPVSLDFMFSEGEVIGNQTLVSTRDLIVEYDDEGGDKKFGPYNIALRGQDKVAIVGPNGTGKSTLIKAIMGEIDGRVKGEVTVHSNARVSYIDQNQTLPHPTQSPLANLMALAPEVSRSDAMHLLVKFNLNRDTATTMQAGDLSGGERAKILLAAVAANKANVLILDEPTNNLDIPTIEAMQDALSTYKGAILLVSHDREFMDGIGITQTVELS